MIDLVLESIVTIWRPALLTAEVWLQPPLQAILLSGSRSWDERVSFLVFDAQEQPRIIARLARGETACSDLQREHQALQALWTPREPTHPPIPAALRPNTLNLFLGSVPRSLGLFDLPVGRVMLEGYLQGVRLSNLMRRGQHIRPAKVRQDFLGIADWLLAFQAISLQGMQPFDKKVVDDYLPAQAAISKTCLDELHRRAEKLDGMPLPKVGMHGDFWVGNMVWAEDADGPGVIDWERFQYCNQPFHDLFFFLLTGALAYPWRRGRGLPPVEAFRRGFLEAGWYANLVREILAGYLKTGQALGLPALTWETLWLYFDLFLLEMASPEGRYGPVRTAQQVQTWQGILAAYIESKNCPALEAV